MRAEIDVQPNGTGRIVLDGHDVSNGVRGFVLRSGVHSVPELELDMPLIDASELSGDVKVIIPDATREALIALGWTPPA